MKYLSVCSGIEAATVAWHSLGWTPVAFSEIEKFPSQVLQHHYPLVPNLGDMTNYKDWNIEPIDFLVGGTPCQSFSVAGLRKGLADPRGNLALVYCGILDHFRPRWFVWENVPGVLSSSGGRDFGSFLGALAELGYGFAYRVLDAQFFGVAQRRRRVFVVGHLGDWRPAAQVLFEPESLRGDPAPSRKKRQEVTGPITAGISKGMRGTEGIESNWAVIHGTQDPCVSDIAFAQGRNNGGENVLVQPMAFSSKDYGSDASLDISPTLRAMGHDGSHPNGGGQMAVAQQMAVRRLTPVECERLQGFPDNYTNIPKAADGPRYKALGNSMAVPVMRWIGKRINEYKGK